MNTPADMRPASTGHAGTGHAGTGHAGTGHASTGHAGTGHAGTGHAGTGHAGTAPTGTAPTGKGVRVRRLLVVIGASVAALAGWGLAVPVGGAELSARMGAGTEPQPVGPVAVVVASLLVGLAGWALLAVLERFTPRAARIWTIVALIVLALSLLGPLGSAVGLAATLVLTAMHLIVGAVLVTGLPRR